MSQAAQVANDFREHADSSSGGEEIAILEILQRSLVDWTDGRVEVGDGMSELADADEPPPEAAFA